MSIKNILSKRSLSIAFALAWLLMACRPEEDLTVKDTTIFDYNFQVFVLGKSDDTLLVNKWYAYEVYIKPFATNKLLNYQKKITLAPTITTGKLGYYQLLSPKGDTLSKVQRFGDIVELSSDMLIDNRLLINQKIEQPNVTGSITQTTVANWNSISKTVTNTIYVKVK
jgi:hypothetical protein